MGKILNGILGGVSGKVAGVVGGSWKGINYLKAYTVPANPDTAGQQTQRGKMTFMVALARLLLTSILQPFWDPFATGMSGFNAFVSHNIKLLAASPDYDTIKAAVGNLEGAEIATGTYVTGTGAVELHWLGDIYGNGASDDTAIQVIVDDGNNIAFVDDTDQRDTEDSSFNIGAGRTVGDIKAYLFFTRGTGETLEVSDSYFLQLTAT